jgi:hypothetical protein
MGSEYTHLLLHSEIRWLSRGKVLRRLFQLRHEVLLFVSEHNSDFASLIADEAWLMALSYLSDIFSKLNELNLSLQGKSFTVLDAYDKIKAFEKKLVLWISYIKNSQFAPFPTLESFLMENDISVESQFVERICNHLETVKQNLEHIFHITCMRNFCGFAIRFRLTVRIMISHYRRKNSYLNSQVTVGLKSNSVILVCLDSGSHLQ